MHFKSSSSNQVYLKDCCTDDPLYKHSQYHALYSLLCRTLLCQVAQTRFDQTDRTQKYFLLSTLSQTCHLFFYFIQAFGYGVRTEFVTLFRISPFLIITRKRRTSYTKKSPQSTSLLCYNLMTVKCLNAIMCLCCIMHICNPKKNSRTEIQLHKHQLQCFLSATFAMLKSRTPSRK